MVPLGIFLLELKKVSHLFINNSIFVNGPFKTRIKKIAQGC